MTVDVSRERGSAFHVELDAEWDRLAFRIRCLLGTLRLRVRLPSSQLVSGSGNSVIWPSE